MDTASPCSRWNESLVIVSIRQLANKKNNSPLLNIWLWSERLVTCDNLIFASFSELLVNKTFLTSFAASVNCYGERQCSSNALLTMAWAHKRTFRDTGELGVKSNQIFTSSFCRDPFLLFHSGMDYFLRHIMYVEIATKKFVPNGLFGKRNQCRNSKRWPFASPDPICPVWDPKRNSSTLEACLVPQCSAKRKFFSFWTHRIYIICYLQEVGSQFALKINNENTVYLTLYGCSAGH